MQLQRLQDRLLRHAARTPDQPALSWPGNSMGYGRLAELVAQYAAAIAACGLPAGAAVLVDAAKSPHFVALLIALGRSGLCPLVVPARLGDKVRAQIIASAGIAYEAGIDPFDRAPEIHPTGEPNRLRGAMPLCLTTSGSTGVPKVVRLTEAGISAFFDWSQSYFGIGPGTRVLSVAPINFDLSLLELWAVLDAGGEVILADPERCTDDSYLGELCAASRPEIIEAVPLFHDRLCTWLERNRAAGGIAPRHVIVTGDVTPQPLRRRMADLFPATRFHNLYGSTETNDSFVASLEADDFAAAETLGIGGPIAGVIYRIVEDGTPGEGELQTATPFLAAGYADPEQTANAFLTELEGSRPLTYFRTGDRVRRRADGTLELLGRVDLVVKLRGVRTNLLDVEQALRHHPAVRDTAAVPYLDPVSGQQQLLAVIEVNGSDPVSVLELRAHCAAHLPKSALPNRYVLTQMPLPKTSTGKLDRARTRRTFTPSLELTP